MSPRNPDRILIVRPSALGDVARTVPVAVAIKRKWPNCRLEWVVNRPFVDAIAPHPAVDEAIPFDRDQPRKVWALMRDLRRRRFDVVYDLQGLARSGLLTWATRAPRRVGFADAREYGWLGSNVRHRPRKSKPAPGEVLAVTRMLELLDADGLPVARTRDDIAADLQLTVDPAQQAWAAAWRNEHALQPGRFLVVAPTAQWGCKCWPVERFADVAATLVQPPALDATVVVVGAPHEAPRIEAVRTALKQRGVLSVWPSTRVAGLMAVLERARLVLANDSAPLHLAVGLGVPTVSVFGPTDPALVGPWGYARWPHDFEASAQLPGARHVVVRAAGADDGATDYRQHRDDDTLIATVAAHAVADAATHLLNPTGPRNRENSLPYL